MAARDDATRARNERLANELRDKPQGARPMVKHPRPERRKAIAELVLKRNLMTLWKMYGENLPAMRRWLEQGISLSDIIWALDNGKHPAPKHSGRRRAADKTRGEGRQNGSRVSKL